MGKLKWLAAIFLLLFFSCSEESENIATNYYRDAYNLMAEKPNEAKILLTSSITFARQEKNWTQLARSYHLLARIQKNQNDFSSALKSYNEAHKYYRRVNDEKYLSDVLASIGVVFFESYGYNQAIDFYLKAIDIKQKIGDSLVLVQLYQNIGQSLRYQSRYDSAIEFDKTAITLLGDIDPGFVAHQEYASNLYNDLGIALKENGDLEEALITFKRSLTLAKETPHEKERTAKALNNIGEVHFKNNDINLAKSFYKKALTLMEEINLRHWSHWRVYNNLGLVYMSENKYDSAIIAFKTVTKENEGNKKNKNMIDLELARSYRNLATAYERLSDKDAMMENLITLAHSEVDVIETHILNDRLYKQLVIQQTMHEIREKEKEHVIKLERTRQNYIALGSGGVFTILLGLFFYLKKVHEKKRIREREEIIRDIENLC